MELGRLATVAMEAAVSSARATVARRDPQVPCYFVFGDSLVDNGNNNYIVSLARANYPPYGIDFAGGPSGRFTNGLTTVDVIGKTPTLCYLLLLLQRQLRVKCIVMQILAS